jgi:DNA-binding NtrC family response regulator
VEANGFGQLVGRSPAIRRVFALLEKVAPTDLSVIVRGASGTGKELAARALHFNSPRRERPFLSENCAALPEPLLESLLFGHVRGAFTGADRDRDGLFVQAGGGTLFLDEIGDMGAALQAKLLRALQEREVRPLGGDHAVRVDVRIVTATHRDLPALVAAGTFRHDLYFRLNGITIDLPSLAERREDVPLLFRHFVARECARAGRDAPETAPSLLRALAAHDWPGNVRELENLARRAVLFAEGDVIDGRALQFDPTVAALLARTGPRPRGPRAGDSGAAIDVRRALEASNGDPRGAAALLGVSRATLYRRMQQLGIVRR